MKLHTSLAIFYFTRASTLLSWDRIFAIMRLLSDDEQKINDTIDIHAN